MVKYYSAYPVQVLGGTDQDSAKRQLFLIGTHESGNQGTLGTNF